jgi:hypothetical protein
MNPGEIESMILDQLKRTGPCALENLVESLPDLTWNQVFAGVDRLSRDGRLTLQHPTRFEYMVSVGPAKAPHSLSAA